MLSISDFIIPSNAILAEEVESGSYQSETENEPTSDPIDLLPQKDEKPAYELKFSTFKRGNSRKKLIAFTFDDGPYPEYTPRLLDVLEQHNVKATFFNIGWRINKFKYLVQTEYRKGHSIGNHSYNHFDLTEKPDEDIAIQLTSCGQLIQEVTDETPHLFRPPGGNYNDRLVKIANDKGYTVVLWTLNSRDYVLMDQTRITNHVLKNISNGGVILFHDGIQETIDALPGIITSLRNRGYEIVTVDEMMQSE